MRYFLLSFLIHLAVVASFFQYAKFMPTTVQDPVPIIDVSLLDIADSTNFTPVEEKAKPADEAVETPEVEDIPPPAAAPPPPPQDVFETEAATPPAPKKEVKKDSKSKDESFEDALAGILSSVDKKPKQQRQAAADKAANLRNVDDAGPRKGYGDMKRMTITVADFIKQQLIAKGCWGDQEDLPDARRLRATIRVRFSRDGHFLSAPLLVDPTREPSNDPGLQVFVQRARNALAKCNNLGFQVPPEYFETQPVPYIDIEFLP